MTITGNVGDKFQVVGSPVLADGVTPSNASLSNTTYSSDNPGVFTTEADPNNPLGTIVTLVGAGTATMKETATATESDGRTNNIQGVLTVVVNVPPPPAAAELVFTVIPVPPPIPGA